MGSKANYLENKLLDGVLGGPDYVRPANVYIALFTTNPTETGIQTGEPSSGSYARVAVANNATNWPAAASGVKANGTAITFPTASGSWGTVAYYGVMDASSAGNMLYYSALNTPKSVTSGDTPVFSIGNLSFTED